MIFEITLKTLLSVKFLQKYKAAEIIRGPQLNECFPAYRSPITSKFTCPDILVGNTHKQ